MKLRTGRILDIVTVGDWALGETKTFTSRDDLNEAERKMFSAANKKMQEELERVRAEEKEKAAETASKMWEGGRPVAKGFAYLCKKGIETLKAVDFIRMTPDGARLLVPVFDEKGQVRSIQTISVDGAKLFLPGGEIKGNFCPLRAHLKGNNPVVVTEGFATAATLYSALSHSDVIVAFNASNLFPVVAKMVAKFGADRIWVAADDDRYNGHNAGQEYAKKCLELGVRMVTPDFTRFGYDTRPTDFNDLGLLGGIGEVTTQLRNAGVWGPVREEMAGTLPAPEEDLWPSKDMGFYVLVAQKNGELKNVPRYYELAHYLREEMRLRISDAMELIWDKDHYRLIGKTEILNLISRLTLEKSVPEHFEKFNKVIRAICDESKCEFDPTSGLINFQNGVLRMDTKELLPHSPTRDFRYVLPYDFDASATSPRWEKFLLEVFEGDVELVGVAQEIFGYTVMGGDPFLHKTFMLYGTGRNGKSVFLKVLQALLGAGNFSNVPIESLGEKHVLTAMIGKLANISPETSKKAIESQVFKAVVGGDEVADRHLYRELMTFRLTCRMFFSGNFFPRFGDNSVGMNERLFILPFRRFFRPEEQDRGLFEKLRLELPGIFNWALAGAERVIAQGDLSRVKAVELMADEYRKESDSVYAFMREKCLVAPNQERRKIGDFYEAYRDYCAEQDINSPREKKGFCMVLKNHLTHEFNSTAVTYDREKILTTTFLSVLGQHLTPKQGELTRRDPGTLQRVIPNYAPGQSRNVPHRADIQD